MTDTTRPDGDELDDQLTIAESDGSAAKDPTAVGGAEEVLPEGTEEPDQPVGLP